MEAGTPDVQRAVLDELVQLAVDPGLDRGMTVERLRLVEKSGGKSGHYQRPQT